jgi:hypothetical protein
MGKKAQMSLELAVMASVMLLLLLAVLIANDSFASSWERQKQKLQASAAADRLSAQIDRAAAFGNGTAISYFNKVGKDVSNMSISEGRSVLVYTVSDVSASATPFPLNVSAPGGIPLNEELMIRNANGVITISTS